MQYHGNNALKKGSLLVRQAAKAETKLVGFHLFETLRLESW